MRFAEDQYLRRLEAEELWRRRAAGHTLDSVPAAGEMLDFATPILNLNRLCCAEPIDELPEAWHRAAVQVAETLKLRHYGIDFKAESLESGPDSAAVIEVNASPSVAQMANMGHRDRAMAAEEAVVRAILELP
jgi:D-alanine-D-alanine ligase-like ATP-grasp enzyme